MKKKISVLKDFGIYELGSLEEVKPILESIDTAEYSDIELDLTGCVPDYPVTSLIVDRIVSQLRNIVGVKKLSIIIDHKLPYETLLNWLFLGSNEFNISNEKSLALAEISESIKKVTRQINIQIIIRIRNFRNMEIIDEIIFE